MILKFRIFDIRFTVQLMTTLTIEIPDCEAQDVLTYIKQKGGHVVEAISSAGLNEFQRSSLEKGLTEAVLISRGGIKGTTISELTYSHLNDNEVNSMTLAYAEGSLKEGWDLSDDENEYWNSFAK